MRPIGALGDIVEFDPQSHEFLGSGTPQKVEIVEVGFIYEDPEGPVVLKRAVAVRPRQ